MFGLVGEREIWRERERKRERERGIGKRETGRQWGGRGREVIDKRNIDTEKQHEGYS